MSDRTIVTKDAKAEEAAAPEVRRGGRAKDGGRAKSGVSGALCLQVDGGRDCTSGRCSADDGRKWVDGRSRERRAGHEAETERTTSDQPG